MHNQWGIDTAKEAEWKMQAIIHSNIQSIKIHSKTNNTWKLQYKITLQHRHFLLKACPCPICVSVWHQHMWSHSIMLFLPIITCVGVVSVRHQRMWSHSIMPFSQMITGLNVYSYVNNKLYILNIHTQQSIGKMKTPN